jgi:small subunit ribosomal protein S6
MNRYETFVILETDVSEEERKAILARVESLISADNGVLLIFDEWGSRKLAYPIRKKNLGYYVRADYCSSGNVIEAIERILTQDPRVLRFMTVLLETDADHEALKAEMTKTEEEPAAPAQEEVPAAEGETVTTGETESDVDKE